MMDERMKRETRDATTAERGPIITENICRNLHVLGSRSRLPVPNRTLEGATVIVAGAGPSLDRNGHLLAKAREEGALVFATANSAGAVTSRGCDVDLLVDIESLDLSKHVHRALKGPGRVHNATLDISASPKTREALESGHVPTSWFLPYGHEVAELSLRFCTPMISGGGAGLTSAVAIAHALGAFRIVLVGVDLSWPVEGSAYAKGSGWEDLQVVKQDDGKLRFDGHDERDVLHKSNDVAPVPRKILPFTIPGWNETLVQTAPNYMQQIDVLSEWSRRDRSRSWINASGQGALIDGWFHLESLPDRLITSEPKRKLGYENDPRGNAAFHRYGSIEADEVNTYSIELINRMKAIETHALALLTGKPWEQWDRAVLHDVELVQLWSARPLIAIRQAGGNVIERVHALYAGRVAAARKLSAILSAYE